MTTPSTPQTLPGISDEQKPTLEKISLLESDLPKLVIAGALSKSTTFTLRVEGPWTKKAALSLLKLLTIQIEIIDDGEEKP